MVNIITIDNLYLFVDFRLLYLNIVGKTNCCKNVCGITVYYKLRNQDFSTLPDWALLNCFMN